MSPIKSKEEKFQEAYEEWSFQKMVREGWFCRHGHDPKLCEKCLNDEAESKIS